MKSYKIKDLGALIEDISHSKSLNIQNFLMPPNLPPMASLHPAGSYN